uniref:Uncharacterized protein n=1 Tax=Aegilops tauschii subsp. strangulata TaxID=200361 RepID=A0A453Q7G3_AEGTS
GLLYLWLPRELLHASASSILEQGQGGGSSCRAQKLMIRKMLYFLII